MRKSLIPILFSNPPTLQQVLNQLGLTSGLQFCLDAGDPISYPGSGQKWLDTSGNGQDFFLGVDGTAEAADPTFVPNGRHKTSWSHDGGDYFTYDTTNESWMNNIHHDGATFTFIFLIYVGAVGVQGICGTNGNSVSEGFRFSLNGSNVPLLAVTNGTGSALGPTGAGTLSAGAWHFLALSVNEPAGTGFIHIDGTANAIVTTYTSPGSGDAANTLQLGSNGNANGPLSNGSRLAAAAAYSTNLTEAHTAAIFAAIRSRL